MASNFLPLRRMIHMLARDTIRIVAGFSSGKVMTSQKIRSVFLTGYTCYENLQSSARLDQLKRIEVRIGAVLGARQAHKYPHLCTGIQRDKKSDQARWM